MIKNSNSYKDRGFTIVELLVVIVVIGILATITIVSYTGITQKANSTKALSNAQSVLSVTEVFASAENFYPALTADLITGKRLQATAVTKLASGVNLTTGATPLTDGSANAEPGSVNGASTIWYQYCGATAAPANTAATGGRIRYWDFVTGAMATNIIYFGTGTLGAGGNVPNTATCNTYVTPAT